jgi:hypothetical protein
MKKQKKQKEQHITSDINTFDQEVSIYKILFQDRATALLKYIIDKLLNDRYENKNNRLPAVMIVGKYGGKHLISRAFSNSMCSNFEFIHGRYLGMGGYSGTLYKNSDTETIYYISSADELSPYSASLLHKFLSQGYYKYRNHIVNEEITVLTDNKLFVFGVNDTKEFCSDLFKEIQYHCYLNNYSTTEMEILVEQRLKWCGINYVKQVPAIIVHNGEGSISKCMRLLSVCFLIMGGDGRRKMTIKDVEIGIGLNLSAEGLSS